MKMKTATLLGMIGAVVCTFINLFYVLLNLEIIHYDSNMAIATNLMVLFTWGTLAIFFYTLYENQK